MRFLYGQRIFPGTGSLFDEHGRALPGLIVDVARTVGLVELTGFRLGTDVWIYGEAMAASMEAIERLWSATDYRRWLHRMRNVIVEPALPVLYEEVFHTNAGPDLAPPAQRGMLSLVIDPERADEYDALHEDPWPELLEALAASGFRRYSGFRRGPHVVYYGQFHPEMRAAFGRMTTYEVDARWGQALEGIISTIRADDGWLITADEVFHLET